MTHPNVEPGGEEGYEACYICGEGVYESEWPDHARAHEEEQEAADATRLAHLDSPETQAYIQDAIDAHRRLLKKWHEDYCDYCAALRRLLPASPCYAAKDVAARPRGT